MKRAIMGAVVICILATTADISQGALMLRFESGADVLEVNDLLTPGFVAPDFPSFVGNFDVTFTFGQIIGGVPGPLGTDLHIDVTSLAAGTLMVELTATDLDLGGQVTMIRNYIGGTLRR